MSAPNDQALPEMLTQAIRRMDRIYSDALAAGTLTTDPTLRQQQPIDQALIDKILGTIEKPAATPSAQPSAAPSAAPTPINPGTAITSISVQFPTPDAVSVDTGLASIRGAPGVQGASIVSVAIGGTSVMRVSFIGDIDGLRGVLQARGWQVSQVAGVLVIRR